MNKVFFSWQSDTPSKINRIFLKNIIESACREISKTIGVNEANREITVDSDTQGVPGQPPIVDTIFNKIKESSIFIADVTFTGKRIDNRPTPNPNVLIEYGWALNELKNERVICVMNEEYGLASRDSLPFDMSHLRWPIRYSLKENCTKEEILKERNKLLPIIKKAIESSLKTLSNSGAEEVSIQSIFEEPNSNIKLDSYLTKQTKYFLDNINSDKFSTTNIPENEPNNKSILERIKEYDLKTDGLCREIMSVVKWISKNQLEYLEKFFVRISESKKRTSDSDYYAWLQLSWYPIMRLIYFAGISAVINSKYDLLKLFSDIHIHDYKNNDEVYPLILHVFRSISGHVKTFELLPGMESRYTPRSDYLFDNMKDIVIESLSINEDEYERSFDKFEALLGLICFSIDGSWGPVGRFGWKYRFNSIIDSYIKEAEKYGNNYKVLSGGLFDGDAKIFIMNAKKYNESIQKRTIGWG